MAKWADYCVSKLSLTEIGMIDTIVLHKDLGDTIDSEDLEQNRAWMVQQVLNGKSFCSIKKNAKGGWNKIGDFRYEENRFSWYGPLPLNLTKRKTFISYYHKDNEADRDKFENLFGDLIVNKSIIDGDIDKENSDNYAKQFIQTQKLHDTTILIVLIGPKTKCRKHVDWEISGALNFKVGDTYAGLLGIILEDHPDFNNTQARFDLMPPRLADNFKSGYALIRDWTTDRKLMQDYIEQAFNNRTEKSEDKDNARLQMEEDICE